MKKLSWLVLIASILITGCSSELQQTELSQGIAQNESWQVIKVMNYLFPSEIPVIEDNVPGYEKYKALAVTELIYDHSIISYIKTEQAAVGQLTAGSKAEIIAFAILPKAGEFPQIPFLVIDLGDEVICQKLLESTDGFYGSYGMKFSIADIDGDGLDEILTQYSTGGNGGYGTFVTSVYKVINSELKKLFSYPQDEHEESLDTGFQMTLADGWNYVIKNKHTGFTCSVIHGKQQDNPYFEEDGKLTKDSLKHNQDNWLGVDPFFYTFEPIDIDSDGKFEIMTAQYAYFYGRSDGIGEAYSVLSWDSDSQKMRIIKAGFWPFQDNDSSQSTYLEPCDDYRLNWYKNQ